MRGETGCLPLKEFCKMNRPKTIICDIDGTLIKHCGDITKVEASEVEILEGVLDKLVEWDKKGYNVILITGRRESLRSITEEQLLRVGISYDKLIMGVGGGPRIVINDLKPDSDHPTAIAINLKRNEGFGNIKV